VWFDSDTHSTVHERRRSLSQEDECSCFALRGRSLAQFKTRSAVFGDTRWPGIDVRLIPGAKFDRA
jgi:hypothetical protein